MTWSDALLGATLAMAIAIATTPVGVSGAVFLLPVQLSVLGVPAAAVTGTNLLYNVIAVPGALLRHRRTGALAGPLTLLLITGTLPGVVIGALVRVFAVPSPRMFRLLVTAVLIPLGGWLLYRTVRPRTAAAAATAVAAGQAEPAERAAMRPWPVRALSFAVGIVGGIYGIGGGALLGPILVARGMPVRTVAPAALACTFVTSCVGAMAYMLLALPAGSQVAPAWGIGIVCGVGGLLGTYLGARVAHHLPEPLLRAALGALAVALGCFYLVQSLA